MSFKVDGGAKRERLTCPHGTERCKKCEADIERLTAVLEAVNRELCSLGAEARHDYGSEPFPRTLERTLQRADKARSFATKALTPTTPELESVTHPDRVHDCLYSLKGKCSGDKCLDCFDSQPTAQGQGEVK